MPNWVKYLQSFNFVSKYKTGKSNIVVDSLSRCYSILSLLDAKVLGFNHIKELYVDDPDFAAIITTFSNGTSNAQYSMQDGFLFKGNRLCIPKSPIRKLLVKEVHSEVLAGHFRINKTIDIL